MKKYLLFFMIAVLFLTSCGGISNADDSMAEGSLTKEPVSLVIGISPYISNTVFWIAEAEGYFEEQGLDVEFLTLKNTSEIMPLLLDGEIDLAAPGLSAAFFNAVARDGDVRIILPLTDFTVKECPTIAFLARTEDIDADRYADAASWLDAKMVISVNGLTTTPGFILANVLAPAGISVDEVSIENVDLPAQEEALRSGQVDIVYAIEPWITRMTAAGDIGVLTPAEQYAPDLTSSVVVAGAKVLDNPEIGERFAIAYLKAVRQYMEGPTDRNVALAVELTGLDEGLVRSLCWSSASPDGLMNMDSVMTYQQWLMDRGLLDEVLDAEDFYEPAFVEAALKALGEVRP
ncbi:MAG: ABC transporter substrate-binding protein [Anaerolineae bacterium]|nr:ABC transporter substrate-binding protein [Anaerolineae bacterium]